MKPSLSSDIVFRVPKFSWKDTLKESWEALKIDISISSPAFYEIIQPLSYEQIERLSEKERFTIWKYFNRAKFRATPFGTFGGFGLARGSYSSSGPIQTKGSFIKHQFVNWPNKTDLVRPSTQILDGNPLLFCNSTFYLTGNQSLRYVSANQKHFELAEVEATPMVLDVLRLTQMRMSKLDLLAMLNLPTDQHASVIELLADMLDLQLLFSEEEPNIIGDDYFQRMGMGQKDEPTPYVICQTRTVEPAELNLAKFKHLPNLIDLLHRNMPVYPNKTLEDFKVRFLRKFDLEEVPLMVALDPEMGVGYDDLEQAGSSSEFAASLKHRVKNKDDQSSTLLNDVLISKLDGDADDVAEVNLEELLSSTSAERSILPNSISVIVQMAGDMVQIEHIGGATANALNGRFTLASEELLKVSANLAKSELVANPDVLFFDVAYMGEANVDNINRRKNIYTHQLSILNFDLSDKPLSLTDILVSVKNSELVLRSQSLNKRLIPRIATAYNYSRSDLSLFRLLCDLQHQNIHSYLLPDLEKWMPNRNRYPRLRYKNLIVWPAKWKIYKGELPTCEALNAFLEKKGVSKMFKCGVSDQLLCFDRENAEDRRSFIAYASKLDHVILEEFSTLGDTGVQNEAGNPLVAQFILTAEHSSVVYKPIEVRNQSVHNAYTVKPQFTPGSEWVYFEIYCHQQRADSVLAGPLMEFLEQASSLIEKWFFIRYTENGDHLRFRVLLKDTVYFGQIAALMNACLAEMMLNGMVSDLQIKTYKRELARYGQDLIERVESHFHEDSCFLFNQVMFLEDEFGKYVHAIEMAKRILNKAFEKQQVKALVQQISNAFILEHELDTSDFKELNKQYGAYLTYRSTKELEVNSGALEQSFINLLQDSEGRNAGLFCDLFHMHVNRLFQDFQRTHELIIYYFLHKDLQREKALFN